MDDGLRALVRRVPAPESPSLMRALTLMDIDPSFLASLE